MASTGTRGPKPWTQHRAGMIFLRVPTADWIAVGHGWSASSARSPARSASFGMCLVQFLSSRTGSIRARATGPPTFQAVEEEAVYRQEYDGRHNEDPDLDHCCRSFGSPAQEEVSACFGNSRWPATTAAATSASLVLARRDWSRNISKASASSTE